MSPQTICVARLISIVPGWFQKGRHSTFGLQIKDFDMLTLCDVQHRLPSPANHPASQRRAQIERSELTMQLPERPLGDFRHH